LRGDPGRDGGIHQAGAVHVEQQAVIPGGTGDSAYRFQRPDRTAAAIAGLLHHHEFRTRRFHAPLPHGRRELVGAEDSVGRRDRTHGAAREDRRSRAFRRDDVGVRRGDDFIARLTMHRQRDLVAHGAGRQEEGRLLAEKPRHCLVQEIDRRVLAALFVAYDGVGNRVAHRGARSRRRVADQVDGDRRRRAVAHAGTERRARPKPSRATPSAKSMSASLL
jgi:hypothetical protein